MNLLRLRPASDEIPMLGGETASHLNSGLWLLNPGGMAEGPAGTVVVAGLGRSGTSMLAAVLKVAGISMGEKTAIGTHEDQHMAALLQARRHRELREWIQKRNEMHRLWGFKLPSHQVLDPSLLRRLRRPYLVVVFRDILAIAGRRQVSKGENLEDQLYQSLKEYRRLVRDLGRVKQPCLLVSYEKALLNPSELVDQLDRFLTLGLDATCQANCEASIVPSPDLYRREVRDLQGWQGRLETIRQEEIAGWAFVHESHTCAQVEIWINGELRHTCLADKQRADVQKDHQLKTPACGFSLQLREPSQRLKPGDRVSVRLANTDQDLLNSPLTFTYGQ